ncbi:hypothetical protein AAMO2058_001033900 [Amorphochlora amoebiformis]
MEATAAMQPAVLPRKRRGGMGFEGAILAGILILISYSSFRSGICWRNNEPLGRVHVFKRRPWLGSEAMQYGRLRPEQQKQMDENGTLFVSNWSALPEEMLAGIDYHQRRGWQRSAGKKGHSYRFLGDPEAAEFECQAAQEAIGMENYDRAIAHYKLAILQDPKQISHREALLATLRKNPTRNYTEEMDVGREALRILDYSLRRSKNHTKWESLIEMYARSSSEYYHEVKGGKIAYQDLALLRHLEKSIGKNMELCEGLEATFMNFSLAKKIEDMKAKGIEIEDEEQDEDEVEEVFQEYKRDPEKQKFKDWLNDEENIVNPLTAGRTSGAFAG